MRDLKQRAIEACGHRGLCEEPNQRGQSGADQTNRHNMGSFCIEGLLLNALACCNNTLILRLYQRKFGVWMSYAAVLHGVVACAEKIYTDEYIKDMFLVELV